MIYVRPVVSALILFLVILPPFSGNLHAETSASTHIEKEQSDASPTTDDDTLEVPETSQRQQKNPLTAPSSDTTSQPQAGPRQAEKEPSTLFYGYWKQGLYIKNPNKRFELKIGGKIMLDGGYLNSGLHNQRIGDHEDDDQSQADIYHRCQIYIGDSLFTTIMLALIHGEFFTVHPSLVL